MEKKIMIAIHAIIPMSHITNQPICSDYTKQIMIYVLIVITQIVTMVQNMILIQMVEISVGTVMILMVMTISK